MYPVWRGVPISDSKWEEGTAGNVWAPLLTYNSKPDHFLQVHEILLIMIFPLRHFFYFFIILLSHLEDSNSTSAGTII